VRDVARRTARSARSAPKAEQAVSWRDGVHLTGTPIWCDARRRRDVCFLSSADRVGRTGHGQLVGTPITLALATSSESLAGHLAVPVHRPFTLGTTRLELIPSGRCLGGAALHVDLGERTVLYAGEIRTKGAIENAEVRSCDALVVAAPFGETHHRFAKLDDVVEQLVSFCKRHLKANKTPVLVVDTALDGLEVATRLINEDIGVQGTRAIRTALPRIFDLLPPKVKRLHDDVAMPPGRVSSVWLRTEGERMKLPERHVVALVSGRALDLRKAGNYDHGFPWPFAAGREELLGWIEQARAKEIFVTGASADAIATKLGSKARVLGPPRQMALFAT
jgi:putative mRNA 3-end processing factor